MAIIATDILFLESTSGLGGAITAVELVDDTLHNLFDVIGSDEAVAGDTEYRCIYIKNNHATLTLNNGVVYINSATVAPETTLGIGLGTSVIDATEQIIGNEGIAPIGVTFETGVGSSNSIAVGDLDAGSTKAIWLRRVVTAGAAAYTEDEGSITVSGDTAG